MKDTNFYPLQVIAISRLTADAVAISLQAKDEETQQRFAQYNCGQYLTLRLTIGGEELRRAYSLCSSPHTDKVLQIGVKQVQNGRVSTHLCQNLKVGDTLEAMPAQGKFSPEIDIDQKKDYFLWAGGSGITPLLSIAKSIVEAEPKSRVMLYYVNRREESILFAEELKRLEQRYRDQIYLQHCLTQPKTEKKGGFLGFFAKTVSNWQGDAGRINAEKISRWVERQRSEDSRIAEHYLCGPEGMMRTISDTLRLRGVETANIHQEYFSDSSSDAVAAAANSAGSNIKVTLNKKTFEVELQPNETILKALIRIKANPPFSCTSGACSTCMAKVMSGKASMSRCLALDESEVQAGYILTCTATPDTAGGELHVNFDV